MRGVEDLGREKTLEGNEDLGRGGTSWKKFPLSQTHSLSRTFPESLTHRVVLSGKFFFGLGWFLGFGSLRAVYFDGKLAFLTLDFCDMKN